jgi:hypothetical protein
MAENCFDFKADNFGGYADLNNALDARVLTTNRDRNNLPTALPPLETHEVIGDLIDDSMENCNYIGKCFDERATNTDTSGDRGLVHDASECIYEYECKDPSASNYSNNSNKIHRNSDCQYNEVCKDPNASNTTGDLDRNKHDQSECTYPETCPYDKVTVSNYDPSHTIVQGRDNCNFRQPKCLNTYANNFNDNTTQDSKDDADGNFFNYGCEFNYGCTGQKADNYNPNAVVDDGSCSYSEGCTYEQAPNYVSSAEYDNGSCNFTPGCIYSEAINYNMNAIFDDGSCDYQRGCTHSLARNYNADAKIDDGSCEYEEGCTYPFTENYNPDAVIDDGSCIFGTRLFTDGRANNNFALIRDCIDPESSSYNPSADFDYIKNGLTSCADGSSVVGCIEPSAANFDETATIQKIPCDWNHVEGCTYDTAKNYDENANKDDGSCEFDGTTDTSQYLIIILVLIIIILGLGYQLLG